MSSLRGGILKYKTSHSKVLFWSQVEPTKENTSHNITSLS